MRPRVSVAVGLRWERIASVGVTRIGIHASHEQIPPGKLLAAVRRAEEVGFRAAMSSDHLVPWSKRQEHSGFAWAWLGAALQATPVTFGAVNAPGQRYHPAIIAQAAATPEAMLPSRFCIAVGTGGNTNVTITVYFSDREPAAPSG